MEKIINLISKQVSEGFEKAGFDAAYGKVTVSNRPDLCEYQCNGAMPAAKAYHKAPIQIAEAVAEALKDEKAFSQVEAVMAQPQRGQVEQLPPHTVPQEEQVLQPEAQLPAVAVPPTA